jgi:hypothetical protein
MTVASFIMTTVMEVLAQPMALCTDCLVRHTQMRADEVFRQLDALRATLVEGRCASCAEVTPVFSAP